MALWSYAGILRIGIGSSRLVRSPGIRRSGSIVQPTSEHPRQAWRLQPEAWAQEDTPRHPSPRSPRLRHSRDVLSTAASWALPLHDASVLAARQRSGGSTSQKKRFSRSVCHVGLGAGRELLRYCSFTIPHPPYQTNSTYFFAVPPLGDLVPWRVVALVAALLWRLSGGKTEMSLEARSRSFSFMIQARPGGAPYISKPCHLTWPLDAQA